MQYLVQTGNILYCLTIEKGEYMLQQLMKIDENKTRLLRTKKIYRGEEMVIDPVGCINIRKKGQLQVITMPVLAMNLIPNK